jgi:hypothetical protein
LDSQDFLKLRRLVMKRIILVTLVLFGMYMLAGGSWPSETSAATPRVESAVVEFADLVKLGGVLLRGEYLVVHDEQRMANGEACTYIYRGKQIDETKLVTSFHCIHIEREKADVFKITIARLRSPNGVPEVQEIQFAGSKDGHRVP